METATLGAKLREARSTLERPVEEVAAAAGISAIQLRKLERDTAMPTTRTLFRLIRILRMDPAEIAHLFAVEEERQIDAEIEKAQERIERRFRGTRRIHALGLRGEPNVPTLDEKRAFLAYLQRVESLDV